MAYQKDSTKSENLLTEPMLSFAYWPKTVTIPNTKSSSLLSPNKTKSHSSPQELRETTLVNGLANANTRRETERTRTLAKPERSEDAAPWLSEIMVKIAMKRPSSNNTSRTTTFERD